MGKKEKGESPKKTPSVSNFDPVGPINAFVRFLAPNPVTSFNPAITQPKISDTAFISPFVSVIGDVTIEDNVFVAPTASLRADEGFPFFIGRNTNIQDGVILHGLRDQRFKVNGKRLSIFIGEGVTVAHGAIVHGPVAIADDVFIGFKSIVFNAIVGKGSFISSDAVVTNGVRIAPNRFVPPGATIDTQEKADALRPVPADREEFAREVREVNREFPAAYSLTLGEFRCSCGLACDNIKNKK